jgi:hypothetical protein
MNIKCIIASHEERLEIPHEQPTLQKSSSKELVVVSFVCVRWYIQTMHDGIKLSDEGCSNISQVLLYRPAASHSHKQNTAESAWFAECNMFHGKTWKYSTTWSFAWNIVSVRRTMYRKQACTVLNSSSRARMYVRKSSANSHVIKFETNSSEPYQGVAQRVQGLAVVDDEGKAAGGREEHLRKVQEGMPIQSVHMIPWTRVLQADNSHALRTTGGCIRAKGAGIIWTTTQVCQDQEPGGQEISWFRINFQSGKWRNWSQSWQKFFEHILVLKKVWLRPRLGNDASCLFTFFLLSRRGCASSSIWKTEPGSELANCQSTLARSSFHLCAFQST